MSEERTEATAVTGDETRGAVRLLVLVDGGAQTFELRRGDTTIGRSRECEVKIEHASVSRKHVVLHVEDIVSIEDLGSANGTRVGAKPIPANTRTPVTPGTIFEIGKVRAVVVVGAPSRSDGPPMEKTRQLVESVARGTISVLLVGETGAGKEVIARGSPVRPRASRDCSKRRPAAPFFSTRSATCRCRRKPRSFACSRRGK